ncbi:hypothetical protein [Arthrobacter sp. C152]
MKLSQKSGPNSTNYQAQGNITVQAGWSAAEVASFVERLRWLAPKGAAEAAAPDLSPFRKVIYQLARTLTDGQPASFTANDLGVLVRSDRISAVVAKFPEDTTDLEAALRILKHHARDAALTELSDALLESIKTTGGVLREAESVYAAYKAGKRFDARLPDEELATYADRIEGLYWDGSKLLNGTIGAARAVRGEIENNYTSEISASVTAPSRALSPVQSPMAIPGLPPSSNIADRTIPNRTPNAPANWSIQQGKDMISFKLTNTGNGDASGISLEPGDGAPNIDGIDSWRSIPAGQSVEFRIPTEARRDIDGVRFFIRWDDGVQLRRERIIPVVRSLAE